MSRRTFENLHDLHRFISHMRRGVKSTNRDFESTEIDLPRKLGALLDLLNSLDPVLENIDEQLRDCLNQTSEIYFGKRNQKLTDQEVDQLIAFNKKLRSIEILGKAVSDDLVPRLEAKLAAADDPMWDYELDIDVSFYLDENDPEFDDDSDNILAKRDLDWDSYGVKDRFSDPERNWCDWHAEDEQLKRLAAEPHCYLFHDLYDHSGGPLQPKLSLKDCLRVGSIQVDAIVRQQYGIDII